MGRFVASESGASAAEYALILAAIAIALMASATPLAGAINGAMTNGASSIQLAANGGSGAADPTAAVSDPAAPSTPSSPGGPSWGHGRGAGNGNGNGHGKGNGKGNGDVNGNGH
jgi:Flp pilus assembly pilin Flp